MIFFRLFCDFLLQVIPFSVLAFFPYSQQLRFSRNRSAALTLPLFLALGTLFAGCG